ncbi:unnamed protein product [Symbiodinium necroappetens]|uniref:Uncharacterized protein n=1 Tax=Symbiodinium necroappetens TaxID=1628268 RepID=A0A813CPY0_9DINO|nr:unnamed protein product [Symbiodinium necroappetens]
MSYCGGHGDRLNGMLSAFVIALLSDRAFFIDSQRPVPLSMVLQPTPGGLDWRMFGSHAALPAGFNLNDNLAAFEQNPRSVLESQEKVIRLVSNQRLTAAALHASGQRAESLGLSRQPALHSYLFQMLFAPSPALQARLNARDLPAGRRIGLHFRAGDQMPQNWKDPPRHPLSELDEFLDCAESLEKDYDWDATFILFADTDKVLTIPRVQELMSAGKLVWPSEPDGLVHLDRSPATLTVRGLLQTWSDWWTLAFDVDALVLCHSGFGATALEIGPRRPAVIGRGCVPADGTTGPMLTRNLRRGDLASSCVLNMRRVTLAVPTSRFQGQKDKQALRHSCDLCLWSFACAGQRCYDMTPTVAVASLDPRP